MTPAGRRVGRVARAVRRSEAYLALRRSALVRARRSPAVRRTYGAWARFLASRRVPAPVPLPAGAAFPEGHGLELPIVVVLALGLEEGQLAAVAGHLQQEQVLSAAFRPVLVVDRPAFGPLRDCGYACEQLLPEERYPALGLGTPWADYVAGHVRRIVATYGARRVVPVGPYDAGGLTAATRAALTTPT